MASPAPRSDPLSQVDAIGKVRPEIGRPTLNRPVFAPYRTSGLCIASEITHLGESPEVQVELRVPAPEGISFADNSATGQLQLEANPMYARRFRRVFGYVGGIQVPPSATGAVAWSPYSFSATLFSDDFLLLLALGALFHP